MFNKKRQEPLKVALSGMDERSRKTLSLYLQGPCKSVAMVFVDASDAQLEIIDADLPEGKKLLADRNNTVPERPLLVLSLHEIAREGVLYVKKPLQVEAMLKELDAARSMLDSPKRAKKATLPSREAKTPMVDHSRSTESTGRTHSETNLSTIPVIDKQDVPRKSAKHKAAMQLDEQGFSVLAAGIDPLDIDDTERLKQACYDPREHFQGFVQSAIKIAKEKDQILQLNSGWKQTLIFPRSNEIWIDADDKQLRVFAGLAINKGNSKKMSITSPDPQSIMNCSIDKFQSLDAAVWKLACWTSKGRFPRYIDIERPVSLKCWPNFTRLLLTPHALRMAALMVDRAVAPIEIAQLLKIKPEYVFVFISATSALGLLEQHARNEAPVVATQTTVPSSQRNPGLLRRIISKLKAN
ncbi:MAG: hypothetical protein Kow0065_06980 [Methylomicrobium sp.]